MTKNEAKKIVTSDVDYVVGEWFETIADARRSLHGGWEEVDEETSEAMVKLGEIGHAEALRAAVVKFLMTREGLELIQANQRPHYLYAEALVSENVDLDDDDLDDDLDDDVAAPAV